MKICLSALILLLILPSAFAQTATQQVLNYTAGNTNQCTIEVSTSNTYSPVVFAVDETKFTNAGHDGQTNAGARQFVIGQKWIARENVSPPSVGPVGGSAAVFAASPEPQVTVTVSNSFAVGDNVTVTGMSNAAFNDPWTRVIAASGSAFTYILPIATTASGTTGGGTITRANQYSLALAANTTYFYRVGGVSNTCSASGTGMPTGSFISGNIPNGNTWEEAPVIDNNGFEIEPTVFEQRCTVGNCPTSSAIPYNFVDPLTGAVISRVSEFSDPGGTFARGWSSAFYRECSLTTTTNGFQLCVVGLGDSGTAGLYSIKSTGEAHYLGLMKHNFTDSNNIHCCNTGTNPYVNADSSLGDTTTAGKFYGIQATNSGNIPNKNVVVSTTLTGADNVDASPAANWTTGASVALTPDPSNTLDDKMAAFAAADSNYSITKFHGCTAVESWQNFLTGHCNSFDQGSPDILYAFNTTTNAVIAVGPVHENPQTRWCGAHGTVVDESAKWLGFSTAYLVGNQTGEWHAQLTGAINNSVTTFSVTSPGWVASTPYSNQATAGFGVVDTNNNLQVATTPGTSGPTVHPTWNATVGGTTSDGTVTWTNEGAMASVGEPQNIFPFVGADGKYWSFLMPAAGAVGAGGTYNGDLFHFEDGTNECVRLVTKGSVTGGVATWSSVTRGVTGNGLTVCAATASAHSAGASLRCLCEEGSQSQALSIHYWDFVDDPHLQNTDNTLYVRQNTSAGHGYGREPAPHGGIWVTFDSFDTHNPFVAGDFTMNPTIILQSQLPFAALNTSAAGVAHQDYTTWDFTNATFKNSAIGSLFFVTGAGTGGYGTFALVPGTTTIYKYILGVAPFSRTLPYVPNSGANTLADISAPSSLLTDTGNNKVCVVNVAGECWAGSAVGEMYASLSTPANLFCNNGGENASFIGHDWCMMNTSTYGDALNQYGLLPADFLGNDSHGTPQYGAGKSRRIVQNAIGGMRVQNLHPHTTQDGLLTLFESCIADPHLYIQGGSSGGANSKYGCQVFASNIPVQPTADGLSRNDYLNVPIVVGSVGASPSYAMLKYGYLENERTRSTTFPPTVNYYCQQYQGTCYWSGNAATPAYSTATPGSATHLSLSSTQQLHLGVPQRVLAYNILYFNASNVQVGSSGLQFIVVDSSATQGPAVSFPNGPVNFGSVNQGSSSAPVSVTVSNSGTTNLILSAGGTCGAGTAAVCVTGTNPGDFVPLSNDLCTSHTLTPGQTCTVSATFTPTQSGTRSASLTITDTTNNVSGSNSLTGTGTGGAAPVIGFSPSPANLGSIPVGGSSSPLTITVSNNGTANLVMSAGAVTISGTNASNFSLLTDNCSSHTVAVGSTCPVAVIFSPSASGARTASLNVINSTGTVSNSDTLNGTGSATSPAIGFAPASPINLGTANIGSSSAPITVTVTNTGNGNLILTALGTIATDNFNRASLGANWTATNGTFDINASTSVEVATTGADSYATMYWNANAAPNDGFAQITATTAGAACNGLLGPTYRMSTTALTYYAVFACNGGLYIQKSLAGSRTFVAGPTTYTPSNGDVIKIAVSGSTITGTATGGITVGPYTDPAPITSGSAGIFGNNLSGTAWEGTPWTFGSGTAPAISITGTNPTDFSFGNDNCSGNTIAPFATCTFTVTFMPTATGIRTALLTVSDSVDSVSGSITLRGTGSNGGTQGMATGGPVVVRGKVIIH